MNRLRTMIIAVAMLLSILGVMFAAVEEAEANDVFAPATLYVAPADSTYATISDALADAQEYDDIVIAPGTYAEQLWVQTDHLNITGNHTGGEIKVSISSGPACFLDAVSYVNLTGINFTSGGGQGVRVEDSDNITMTLCNFWSTGGTSGALGIKDSEAVFFSGYYDDETLDFSVIHSEGDNNPAIKIDNSDEVMGFLLDVYSDGAGSDDVATFGTCSYLNFMGVFATAEGSDSNVFDLRGNVDAYISNIFWECTGDFISIQNGLAYVEDTDVPDDGVDISMGAMLEVINYRDILALDEDDNPVEGVDLKVYNSIEDEVYATGYYGGFDDRTDEDGLTPWTIGFYAKYFDGSNTPVYGETDVYAHYSGGDVPVDVYLEDVDANTTDTLEIYLPDFWVPLDALNVTAETMSHEEINFTFKASPSPDVDHYEVWKNFTGDWEWELNSTEAYSLIYTDLIPATMYGFRVIAVDGSGHKSPGVDVYNTTLPPIEGKIDGKVTYTGGPLNGTNATNATVFLFDTSGMETINKTIGEDGLFDLGVILFADNYTLKVIPEEVVVVDGEVSGYTAWEWNFNHSAPLTKDVEIEHYQYVTPPLPKNGTLEGMITYNGGDMPGMNATNATVLVLNETGVELASMVVNETGLYSFEELGFGINYTLKVIPVDVVEIDGTASGYYTNETLFNFTLDSTMDVMLEYYTYTPPPPTSGPISGTVTLSGGDRDGEGVEGAFVSLLNSTDAIIANTTTNETGYYVFADVTFENDLTISVTPPAAILGEEDVKDGYIPDKYAFDHTSAAGTAVNLELSFYDYEEPVVHPQVTITDADENPLEGVEVTVTTGGSTYTATTNANGVAVFDGLEGTGFPADAEFEAVKEGYDDISWNQGDSIPDMSEEDSGKETDWTIVIIIAAIIALLVLGLIIFAFRGKSGEDLEEE